MAYIRRAIVVAIGFALVGHSIQRAVLTRATIRHVIASPTLGGTIDIAFVVGAVAVALGKGKQLCARRLHVRLRADLLFEAVPGAVPTVYPNLLRRTGGHY